MASKILLPLLFLAATFPASLAVIDVAQMLTGMPQYSSFLKLLTDTKVAVDVSRLKSASVLVVTDEAIKPLLSVPADKQRIVLLNHVLLKYFDPIQLNEMKVPTATLATLLSNTDKRLGFINYWKAQDGQMYLSAPGAADVAKLIEVVAARPFAVSIMEVSKPVMSPELAGAVAKADAAGHHSKGGKGKVRPLSDESGGSNMATKPASEAVASTAEGSGSPAPSAVPTTTPK